MRATTTATGNGNYKEQTEDWKIFLSTNLVTILTYTNILKPKDTRLKVFNMVQVKTKSQQNNQDMSQRQKGSYFVSFYQSQFELVYKMYENSQENLGDELLSNI